VIRWGVVGPGGIATRFAQAVQTLHDGRIVAVASRSQERATAFAQTFSIERSYADYAALAEDPDVDAVYVATPHSGHEQDTLRYLRAGKHVLCEKPLALNSAQAERMVAEARSRGLFLMEAVWSRFLPAYRLLSELLEAGRIGEPLQVEADFGFAKPVDPTHRLYDPNLGGGALLDLGIYPLQLCSLVLGSPDRVAAQGYLGSTGVDEQVAAVLRSPTGSLGIVKAGLRLSMSCTARITGTSGQIDLPVFMHCPQSLTLTTDAGTEQLSARYEGNGLQHEIAEVHRCLQLGLHESPLMPLDETLALARTLDEVRRQIGLVYPGEAPPAAPGA
jgi:predicted dehydrogenase